MFSLGAGFGFALEATTDTWIIAGAARCLAFVSAVGSCCFDGHGFRNNFRCWRSFFGRSFCSNRSNLSDHDLGYSLCHWRWSNFDDRCNFNLSYGNFNNLFRRYFSHDFRRCSFAFSSFGHDDNRLRNSTCWRFGNYLSGNNFCSNSLYSVHGCSFCCNFRNSLTN